LLGRGAFTSASADPVDIPPATATSRAARSLFALAGLMLPASTWRARRAGRQA